ncbi:hypothetical protein PENTCL1PPCAC_19058 [Pristionchus entomophagus]|uniref:Secreted protein n=1 Tax=Pristionchus entomophagus TaxID=358040 RepID=A0AAV5TQX8_9BILA|nr:hypothetical protein PENTCL1PPCAC_19058 [Pristionchus entomophagus]
MQRLTFVLLVVAVAAECASLRYRRDLIKQNKQIEDFPPFDNDDRHTWNHPWHKSFNAEHSSHGDITIFSRGAVGAESDSSLGGLTPVVPDVSHSNRQLAPDADRLGTLILPAIHVAQR